MRFARLFQRKPRPAETLYGAIVATARQPKFYAEWGVPDTVDGRFDMIVLVQFLVQERMKADPSQSALAQELADTFFADMDRSLREMGVGDLSVGKKVRKMAEACYGRWQAYAVALPQGEPAMEQALRRNVFQGESAGDAARLAAWSAAAHAALARQSVEAVIRGEFHLP